MTVVLALLTSFGAEPQSCLLRVDRALQLSAQDVPTLQLPAETAAARLAHGAKIWAAGQPAWVSEITGRAGGLMMIKPLADNKPGDADVVLYAPDAPTRPGFGQSYVITLDEMRNNASICAYNHADDAGVSHTMANTVSAWVFTGELIAALTRLGRMPVIYESIGMYGGNARIAQYKDGAIPFHDAIAWEIRRLAQ